MAAGSDNFNDLKELGIDCDSNDSLTETFNRAANHLQSLLPNVDNQTLLLLYGHYKQGMQGRCDAPKPSWYDMKGKSKWEAWNKLGNLPQDQAKTVYIQTIQKLDPSFDLNNKDSWVTVSTLQHHTEPSVSLADKNLVYHVKDENSEEILKLLPLNGKNVIDKLDDEGLGLIHWASDRGSLDILNILIEFGANVNLQDTEGQTALHYAASCGHVDCVKYLLTHDARRDLVDNNKDTPLDVASDEVVRELLANLA